VKKRIARMANKYKFDYYNIINADNAIIDQAYSEAVYEIVDYWVSAWGASGHDIKFYKQDDILKNNDSFSKRLLSLVMGDAIDILPDELVNKLTPGDNIDFLLSSSSVKTSKYDLDLSVFLNQAKGVTQNFFPNITDDLILPDTVYYSILPGGQTNINDSFLDINDIDDRYSILLSTLLSLWIENFKEKGFDTFKMPKEGIYLRDRNFNLYYYGEDDN